MFIICTSPIRRLYPEQNVLLTFRTKWAILKWVKEMKFKLMSEDMTEDEIRTAFQIVLPFGKMLDYERHPQTNYISVHYVMPEEKPVIHEMELLPDDVYFQCEKVGKERLLEDGEKLYQYRQFMVARGYSEIWLSNPYCINK